MKVTCCCLLHSLTSALPNALFAMAILMTGNSFLFGQPPASAESDRMFQELDTNSDKKLSLDDVRANNRPMLEQILKMAGKSSDASVSKSEFEKVFQAHQAAQRGGSPRTVQPATTPQPSESGAGEDTQAEGAGQLLARLCDQNGDGQITRSEWSRLTQMFSRLDANKDGKLIAEELDAIGETGDGAVGNSESSDSSSRSGQSRSSGSGARGTARTAAGLDGTWRGWVVSGRGEDPNSGEMEIELTIRGGQVDGRELGTNRAPQGGLGSGTFTMAGDGSSGTMDAVQTSGPESGRTYQGVYELDGNTLRWCVTARNRQRPTVMATDRGNYLMILRRQ